MDELGNEDLDLEILAVGDVVFLLGSEEGPAMTVVEISAHGVSVVWFDKNDQLQWAVLSADVLSW